MNCTNCEAPGRKLWVLFGEHRRPSFTQVQTGNWITLQRCPDCSALWCVCPYEPYAAFSFAALWPYDQAQWQRVHAPDEGVALCRWHAFMVVQHHGSLPMVESEQIARWRRRSYGHNPIDSPDQFHIADLPSSPVDA